MWCVNFRFHCLTYIAQVHKKKNPTKENGIETKQPPPQLAIAITTMPPPIINHSQRVTQQHYPYPLAAAHILFLKYTSKYNFPTQKVFSFFPVSFLLNDIVLCWSLMGKVGSGIICSSNPSRHSHSAGSHFMVGISQVFQAPLRIQLTTYTLDPSPMYTVPPSAGWQLLRCWSESDKTEFSTTKDPWG